VSAIKPPKRIKGVVRRERTRWMQRGCCAKHTPEISTTFIWYEKRKVQSMDKRVRNQTKFILPRSLSVGHEVKPLATSKRT
jgi:hypothetical protein